MKAAEDLARELVHGGNAEDGLDCGSLWPTGAVCPACTEMAAAIIADRLEVAREMRERLIAELAEWGIVDGQYPVDSLRALPPPEVDDE